jgi:ribose transport system substrate-binding protein
MIAAEVATRELAGQVLPRTIWSPTAIINADNVDMSSSEIINWTDPEYE